MVKHHGKDPSDGRPVISAEDGDRLEDLQKAAANVGVWQTAPIEVEPSVRVTHWMIYAFDGEESTMILASYQPDARQGRVSTLIKKIDAEQMLVETASGRVYELIGPPASAPHTDTEWVINTHFRRLGVDPNRLLDVTPRYFPALCSDT